MQRAKNRDASSRHASDENARNDVHVVTVPSITVRSFCLCCCVASSRHRRGVAALVRDGAMVWWTTSASWRWCSGGRARSIALVALVPRDTQKTKTMHDTVVVGVHTTRTSTTPTYFNPNPPLIPVAVLTRVRACRHHAKPACGVGGMCLWVLVAATRETQTRSHQKTVVYRS